MALLNCNFFSCVLGYDTSVVVILPEEKKYSYSEDSEKPSFKTLYLLHGMGDDSSSWSRFTSIERYAKNNNLAVIMPTAEHSFYTDAIHGKKYFTFITEELPYIMKRWFPLSNKPEDTFIAGLSMGGYGALKIGFTYPERFGGIASFSGVTSLKGLYERSPENLKDEILTAYRNIFGDIDKLDEKHDLLKLARKNLMHKNKSPKIIQYIGTEDSLYNENTEFKNKMMELEIPIVYEEWEGKHDWEFWDIAVLKAIKIFLNGDYH
ncbi:alpha/beta hydrolase [Eubacterium multiforme]|uniref:Tributyrin esterase n=1 Tax=Eubacterium multiforme TaxID=83339 RepID=A0ABT9UYC4_9FIRM|nr:alpha/beta hydrolase family protein [Eubacterium multiforme]MDQ0151310.1 putative tributyrin esterase [Eubacterium multiforme]